MFLQTSSPISPSYPSTSPLIQILFSTSMTIHSAMITVVGILIGLSRIRLFLITGATTSPAVDAECQVTAVDRNRLDNCTLRTRLGFPSPHH